jgi:hypothetical protein
VPGTTIDVWGEAAVQRTRGELYQALEDEGYRKGVHRNDRVIFRPDMPAHPRVIVHDDGWVYLRREPPRLHSPGKSFTDEGSPAAYLWCVLAPTSCVSVGGWVISKRKYHDMGGRILDETHPYVIANNEAVARREMARRVNVDIPSDLATIWALELPPADRRRLLFEYWDTRNDNPSGDEARRAIEAFILGVVQQSPDAFSPAEIAALNGSRHCEREFLAVARVSETPPTATEP